MLSIIFKMPPKTPWSPHLYFLSANRPMFDSTECPECPIINCSGSCPCYKLGLLQQPPIRTPRHWDTGPRSGVKHYHGEEIEAEERKVLYQALSETIKLSDKGPALPSSDCLSLYYTLLSLRCIIKLYLESEAKRVCKKYKSTSTETKLKVLG